MLYQLKKSILLIFIVLSFPLAAQSHRLTVDELFERGIENSLAIQASVIKTQLLDDKESLAKNKRLPDIALGGLVGYVGTPLILDKDLSYLKQSETPDWKQNYQLSVTQPLYQGGRIKKGIERAQIEKEIAQLSLQKDKSDLKLWLMSRYLDLFNLYKRKEVYAQHIEESKNRLQDIENMKVEGMITNNDVLRSKLTLTNDELAYTETGNDIILVSQQLDIVLGLDENTLLEPDETFLSSNLLVMPETEYVNQAYAQYSDMQIAGMNIALAKNNLSLTNADILPVLSLQASNTLARPIPSGTPAQDLFLNAWGVTLNLSYHLSPLFDRKYTTNIAKRQINLQELAQEQQGQTIRTQVKAAYIKHQEAGNRVKALEESRVQANENYRIVKNKYFNQLAILTDLLDANTVQLNAELQLTAAKTNAIYTYYQLQKVSGNL
jgi:outer membrane protein TolC